MPRRWIPIALVSYAGASLLALRAVVGDPAGSLPVPKETVGPYRVLQKSDQQFVLGTVTRHAQTLASGRLTLFETGQCHPMTAPLAFGEPMIVEGAMMTPTYVATGEPILAFNVMLVASLVIAATTMCALAYDWTGSGAAAWVAGLLFGFSPLRVVDTGHPFVHGDFWTPLVFLFAARVCRVGGWGTALVLAAVTIGQAVESFYPALALAIVGIPFGVWLVCRDPGALRRTWGPLLLATIVVVAACGAFFAHYLHARTTWGILADRGGLLFLAKDFLPGGGSYPGSVLVGLALLGLADRWRGRRETFDPRGAITVGGALVLWTIVLSVPIPGTSLEIPSLSILIGRVVPGFSAVRAVAACRIGLYFALAVLAAYGVRAVESRLRGRVRAVVVASLGALALGTQLFFPTAVGSVAQEPYAARPSNALVALLRALPDGAVLDLPFATKAPPVSAHQLFLAAWHTHPVAACTNSFVSPLAAQIRDLAMQVPEERTLRRLGLLGFRSLLLHAGEMGVGDGEAWTRRLDAAAATGALVRLGEADGHVAYAVRADESLRAGGVESLGAVPYTLPSPLSAGQSAAIDLKVRPATSQPFRLPAPVEPIEVAVEWSDGGGVVRSTIERTLLPVVLLPGEEGTFRITTPVPPVAGTYTLVVRRRGGAQPLGTATVQVGGG